MNPFKKEKKENEVFTPSDLESLSKQTAEKSKRRLFGLFSIRRAGEAITATQMVLRAALGIATAILILMGIAFVISSVIVNSGNLTIEVNKNGDADKVLSLSETADFKNPSSMLEAQAIKDMDNITYRWLPEDLDKKDGSHNGKNYIAYSFYIENAGKVSLDYTGSISVVGAAKSIDEAVRVMIYKNGDKTVYAKPNRKSGKAESDPDVTPVNFKSNTIVMSTETANMAVGQKDKYTIVIWLEGEDPECVNDVMGGILKMRMNFEVKEDKTLV